jgi:hypothetical protein
VSDLGPQSDPNQTLIRPSSHEDHAASSSGSGLRSEPSRISKRAFALLPNAEPLIVSSVRGRGGRSNPPGRVPPEGGLEANRLAAFPPFRQGARGEASVGRDPDQSR